MSEVPAATQNARAVYLSNSILWRKKWLQFLERNDLDKMT